MSQNLEDYTWKDIPWANPERPPLGVNEGTRAVIPELNDRGEPTGEFLALSHEDYMRIMGSLAYVQERSNGDPARWKSKPLPERIPEPNPVVRRKAMLPPGGMKK